MTVTALKLPMVDLAREYALLRPEIQAALQNVLERADFILGEDDTVATVYDRFNALIEEKLGDVVQKVIDGDEGRPQAGPATYCVTRLPEDGLIDWSRPTKEIHDLVRALTRPFPGAFTYYHGEPMIVWATQRLPEARTYEGRIPGRVVQVHDGRGLEVLTGDGSILVTHVQYQARNLLASQVVRTTRATLGLNLPAAYDALRRKVAALEARAQAESRISLGRP